MEKNKINITLPVNDRAVDAAQRIIDLYCQDNDTKKLRITADNLTKLVDEANKNGLPRDADKLASLVRLVEMHLYDNEQN